MARHGIIQVSGQLRLLSGRFRAILDLLRSRSGFLLLPGDDHYGRKLIVFSSCCLPPSHQLDHHRLLECVHVTSELWSVMSSFSGLVLTLFSCCRYLKFTLDQYVEMDYILVYFHHGLRSSNKPSLKWLREAYSEFDRK